MDKASQFFGTAPRLTEGVSDIAAVLSPRDNRRLHGAIQAFERRFPQVGFTAAFMAVAPGVPLQSYAFWIFKRCALGGETATGGMNRHVFLLIDTTGQRSALMTGYGLEPFVSKQALTACLQSGLPGCLRHEYAAAATAILAAVEKTLREISSELPRIFGVSPIQPAPRENEPREEPASTY